MQIFLIWLIVRILVSLSAIIVSPLRPLTEIERNTPIWPPLTPISIWLTRIFLSPLQRWDVDWYLKIVVEGYGQDGTAQFHPLFPAIAKIFHQLDLSALGSLFLVSTIAGIALFICYNHLAQFDHADKGDALFSLLFFAFSPTAFVLFIPYSEGLFLLWVVICLYCLRHGFWWYASIAGAFAVLTRQQGLFLILPILWEFWEYHHGNIQENLKNWKSWISFGLLPLAMLVWIGYRGCVLNDLQIKATSLNSFIYTVIVSPTANRVVPEQVFIPPWKTVGFAIEKLIKSADADLIVNLVGGILLIILFLFIWRYLRVSDRLYSLAIILVSFSYYTGEVHPTMGLLRHLMLAIPVYLGAPLVIRKPALRLTVLAISMLGMIFLLTLYLLEAWVV